MKDWASIRVRGGVALLCMSSLFYAVEIYRRTHVLSEVSPQPASQDEMRLGRIKKMLPAHGVVGYTSDDSEIDESVAWRRFAMTQYSLAPLIIERNTKHDLIIGVFQDPGAIPSIVAKKNLRIVEQFDKGVVLLQKK